MQTANPFTLSISRYKEVQEAKKRVIYYVIEINKKDAEDWRLEKRFKEFDELNTSLRKTYANLPHFPGKSMFALKEDADIEKRRSELENYMQILVTRTDIMSSEVLKRFLELENFAPEMTATPPKLLADIQGLILGVRDFHYQVDEGLFFTCLSDMSVTSRVDSYITNIKMPWNKETNKTGLVTVGAVECYMQTGSQGELKFEKLWFKTFQVQVINIYWDQASCLLLIGKDDGSVTVLKVSSELNYIKYDEVVTTKLHQGRIMGTYIDSISEFVYSIAEDKKLKVYDLRKNEHVADIACGSTLLTVLYPDKENKRLFVSNRNGQVFLYDISSGTPKLVHIIQAHSKGAIRGIYFDAYRNYLLTGNYDDGTLALIDMQKPDRAKYSHIITHLKGRKKIRCVTWSSSKGEVYAGGEDGTVTFWDIKKSSPIFAMKCHTYGITKLQLINDSDILITGGKDNRLRFYKLPQEWIDKRLEPEAMKIPEVPRDSEIQKITASVLESKRQTQRALDDSEDEPEGWAKGL